MAKVSTWLPLNEAEQINRVKGDSSTSLFVRRAIRKAVQEATTATTNNENVLSGRQATNQAQTAAVVSSFATHSRSSNARGGSSPDKKGSAVG